MCTRAICLASLTVAGRIMTSVTSSTMTRPPAIPGCLGPPPRARTHETPAGRRPAGVSCVRARGGGPRHPGMAGCRVMVEDVTEVLIRPATVSDARQIARVHIASWREAYADVIADVYLAHLDVDRSRSARTARHSSSRAATSRCARYTSAI